MPSQFKVELPDTLAIIDCTELKAQKPSSLKLQSQMYSDYKSATTLKGLVACKPMGNIIFVSELFTGSMSDVEITEKSGFYKILEQDKFIMDIILWPTKVSQYMVNFRMLDCILTCHLL